MKEQAASVIFFILDLLYAGFFCCFVIFVMFRSCDSHFDFYTIYGNIFMLIIVMIVLFYEGIYSHRYDFWEETRLMLKALVLSYIIVLAMLVLKNNISSKHISVITIYFVGLCITFPIYKRVIKKIVYRFPYLKKSVKVIGNKEQVNILEKEFAKNWYLGFRVVASKPDTLFLVSKGIKQDRLYKIVKRYSKYIKDIYILPYINDINFSQSKIIELFNIRTSAIKIENNLLKRHNVLFKEIVDKAITLMIIPFFTIIHIVVSYLIKKDSNGEVLFKQDRIGKDKKIFKCYKYRTMHTNNLQMLDSYLKNHPEEVQFYKKYHKYKNDPRVTKIGHFLRKYSLDELPQIINVLKGEMNLVGPRPYMPNEIPDLRDDIELITRVKPGITGLWQVSGRSDLSFEERKKLDNWYIQNWSIWMDIVILMKTIKVVLFKTGAR